MDQLYRLGSWFGGLRLRWDDDLVDRVNHAWTGILLVLASFLVSTKQYVGEPLVCWLHGDLAGKAAYINNICWISNTYFVPFDHHYISPTVPQRVEEREDKQLSYYQWVPFVLLLQAMMFNVPCVIWRSLNDRSGINVRSIVTVSVDSANVNPENRAKSIQYLSRHVDECLRSQIEYRSGAFATCRRVLARYCLYCGKRQGNYLIWLYFLIKLAYIGNVVMQLYLLDSFLGSGHHLYGYNVMNDLRQGIDWRLSGRFPRVTLCDFVIMVLGNMHRHTVQCVLPINMFNEMIYLVIWWWFVLLAAWSIISTFGWAWHMLIRPNRRGYIKKILKILDLSDKERRGQFKADPLKIDQFVDEYLRMDGVFVLRLVQRNAGDIIVLELSKALWDQFGEGQRTCRPNHTIHGNDSGVDSGEMKLLK